MKEIPERSSAVGPDRAGASARLDDGSRKAPAGKQLQIWKSHSLTKAEKLELCSPPGKSTR